MVDDPWTQGKCALKVLQYMAAGLPVISANVAANKEAVIDKETGFLVNSNDEWLAAILQLVDDPMLRMNMGTKGKQRVRQHYDINVVANHMTTVIDQFS